MKKRTAREFLKAVKYIDKAQNIITKECGMLEDAGEVSNIWGDMLWTGNHLSQAVEEGMSHHINDCLFTLKRKNK